MLFCLAIEEKSITGGNVFTVVLILTLWGIVRKRRLLPDKAKAFVDSRWHPCEVRLRALHIRLMRGSETPPAVDETCTCLNCGTTYTGNYCRRCGQSRTTTRYRFRNVLKNIVVGFFKVNNEFGRTLMELLYRPGYMIRDFIGGKRVKYSHPFQSLFILAALYIMAVQIVDPAALSRKGNVREEIAAAKKDVSRETEKVFNKVEKRALSIALNHLDKNLSEQDENNDSVYAIHKYVTKDKDDNLFEKLIKDTSEASGRMERFFSKSTFLINVWNTLKRWGHGNKALSIIITLPLFAFATQIAFRRRKYVNYTTTEQVIIQAYIACMILLISIIVLPFNGYATVDNLYELPSWVIFVLFCWNYKQLYHCTWWKSFWHTALMMIYSIVILILFASLATAFMLVSAYVLTPIL